jgi:SAM-dependent methyltransferase
MGNRISFDRAADYYDATRDLDPAARRQLTAVLLEQVQGRTCLEVGIGTGLVGLELARHGVRVDGVDLSVRMLGKLVRKLDHRSQVRLVQADVADLPFPARCYDTVLASQMLHLLDDWRLALDEIVRVLRPGGRVVLDLGNEPDSGWGGPWSEVAAKFWSFAPPRARRRPEVWDGTVVEEEMERRGFVGRPLAKIEAFESLSLDDVICRLEQGLWSSCWSLSSRELTETAGRTRVWAKEVHEDLTVRHRIRRVIACRAYDA